MSHIDHYDDSDFAGWLQILLQAIRHQPDARWRASAVRNVSQDLSDELQHRLDKMDPRPEGPQPTRSMSPGP